jgi:hypothetical protein
LADAPGISMLTFFPDLDSQSDSMPLHADVIACVNHFWMHHCATRLLSLIPMRRISLVKQHEFAIFLASHPESNDAA